MATLTLPMIQAAVLHVPEIDNAAGEAIRILLRDMAPSVVILHETYAASHRHWIEDTLRRLCDEDEMDLVMTVGGTLPAPGPGSAEIVPEATLAIVERLMPGLPEAMRAFAQDELPLAMLDRSMAGIRGRTLVLNLPAGESAASLFLESVVDLLAPVVEHLRENPSAPRLESDERGDQEGEDETAVRPNPTGLDAREFAAFLERKRKDSTARSDS